MHTSTPSFERRREDDRGAEGRQSRPQGSASIGAKVAVEPDREPRSRRRSIDFVARNEFDFTIKEIAEGRDLATIAGLTWRNRDGAIVHNPDRAGAREHGPAAVRHRRSTSATSHIENYFIGYLQAPLPLVLHRARLQVALHLLPVAADRRRPPLPHPQRRPRDRGDPAGAKAAFPQVKEFFFDDDTFTDNAPRAEAIARELGKLGVVWSCNAKANVPRATLKVLRTTGCGCCWSATRAATSRSCTTSRRACWSTSPGSFTKDCHELGIMIHGTFILGLPGETQETIRGDDRVRQGDQPAHDPGVAGRALSRHLPVQAGAGERLARRRQRRAGRRRTACRSRRCTIPISSTPRSSSRWRTSTALLFPRPEDRLDRRRDGRAARR